MLGLIRTGMIACAAVDYESRKRRLVSRPGPVVMELVEAHSKARQARELNRLALASERPVHAAEKAVITAIMMAPILGAATHGVGRKPTSVSQPDFNDGTRR
jgi:hypothetical protein